MYLAAKPVLQWVTESLCYRVIVRDMMLERDALSANEINKTRKAINDAGFYFSFEFLKVRESALHVFLVMSLLGFVNKMWNLFLWTLTLSARCLASSFIDAGAFSMTEGMR
jgi:hypothetical protein